MPTMHVRKIRIRDQGRQSAGSEAMTPPERDYL
jgi:hypothetical protein